MLLRGIWTIHITPQGSEFKVSITRKSPSWSLSPDFCLKMKYASLIREGNSQSKLTAHWSLHQSFLEPILQVLEVKTSSSLQARLELGRSSFTISRETHSRILWFQKRQPLLLLSRESRVTRIWLTDNTSYPKSSPASKKKDPALCFSTPWPSKISEGKPLQNTTS